MAIGDVLKDVCVAVGEAIPPAFFSTAAGTSRTWQQLQLLANEGIDSDKLMPRHPDPRNPQTIEQGHDPLFPIYLPLKVSPASTES